MRHSIFFRIYASLVLLCVVVALIAYLLVQGVNYKRAQAYREEMAAGVFYIITQGIARQTSEQTRQNWLDDASILLNLPLKLVPSDSIDFSRREQELLENEKSVVRYNNDKIQADIYTKVPNENLLLATRVDKAGEQQIKAMAVFMLDDLVYYPGQEQKRLKEIRQHFPYPIAIQSVSKLGLDIDQLSRIRRKEVIMLLRDGASATGTSISVVSPTSSGSEVLVMGPIPMFNWLPFHLFASVTLIGLLLISLGVYSLILPLERKIRLVRNGLNQVRTGNLDARVQVDGEDEIDTLALSFNGMAEHIKRLIEAQRELTRAVSHELRTPVARVRFGVEMLADTDDYESRLEQQLMIDKDIEALNTLIDEILTYAKLEQGTPSLNFEEVPLYKLVRQVAEETRSLGLEPQVLTLEPDHELLVSAEKLYLHRVMQNLAGNAMRYANHRIRISGGVENGKAYICVEDDGPGILEKDREKIFEPFSRLDDSRTRAAGSAGGYGLGLSIVSRIAFWFGGHISVDQSPDLGGARFKMCWPVKRPRT
ncbi:two-component sensor histidine kinase [Alkanindiges hydrocarboniclasticus]|uniref:histidine kinase n=1 Tax=Alkanindiges hydrocarboniclasticus TaxID=1907941 RepID=A0A1S8CV68_9GAMM|nr:ATP-binding protein [Alkanindiges hydrocarboniclasticus]ONG39222.1 two-component sensor histidine kinase [Alkanindiges hydrocarboniclasticus]